MRQTNEIQILAWSSGLEATCIHNVHVCASNNSKHICTNNWVQHYLPLDQIKNSTAHWQIKLQVLKNYLSIKLKPLISNAKPVKFTKQPFKHTIELYPNCLSISIQRASERMINLNVCNWVWFIALQKKIVKNKVAFPRILKPKPIRPNEIQPPFHSTRIVLGNPHFKIYSTPTTQNYSRITLTLQFPRLIYQNSSKFKQHLHSHIQKIIVRIPKFRFSEIVKKS